MTTGKRDKMLKYCLAIGLYIGAMTILWHHVSAIPVHDVWGTVENTPLSRIWIAIGLTALAYICYAVLDMISARTVVPGQIPLRLAGFAGAAGYAVSNTLGFVAVTGTALRYRIYATRYVTLANTTKVMANTLTGLGLGFVLTILVALLTAPDVLGQWGLPLGGVIGLFLLGTIIWLARKKRVLSFRGWTLPFPDARSATIQTLIGMIELSAAIGVLYVLLPADIPPFNDFVLIYMGAVLLGRITATPGGFGVFEAAMITGLVAVEKTDIVAALLLYRVIYNLLPLVVACITVAIFEIIHHTKEDLPLLEDLRTPAYAGESE